MSHKPELVGEFALPAAIAPLVEEARSAERAVQYALARSRYEQALQGLLRPELARAAPHFAAALVRWVGSTLRDEGNADAALDCYTASLAMAEAAGDRLNMAHALNSMGLLETQWGHLDAAEELYARARELAESVHAVRLLAMLDQNTGVVANIRGDLLRALKHYREGLDRYRQLEDELNVGKVLNCLGMIHTDLGEWAEADERFAEAALWSRRVSDQRTCLMIEVNRAELYLLQGDYARARESCDASFELASHLDDRPGLGEVYKNYGVLYRATGKFSLAETHLKTAAEIAERYANPLLAGEVQRELAQLYHLQDRNRETLQALNYAHRVFTELRARLDLADTNRRLAELERSFLDVVRKWGESIESKDRYTAGHCQRVADYGCMLARAVGFDEQTIKWFRMGAFLHDVGKTVVPAEILNKQGDLTPVEWETMRRHTLVGVELLAAIDFPWDIKPMVRSHHERWDGRGYPDGLAGRNIPLAARILCVADVFDALTTNRSYRHAYPADVALGLMSLDVGQIFDPELFERFQRVIEERLDTGASVAIG